MAKRKITFGKFIPAAHREDGSEAQILVDGEPVGSIQVDLVNVGGLCPRWVVGGYSVELEDGEAATFDVWAWRGERVRTPAEAKRLVKAWVAEKTYEPDLPTRVS